MHCRVVRVRLVRTILKCVLGIGLVHSGYRM